MCMLNFRVHISCDHILKSEFRCVVDFNIIWEIYILKVQLYKTELYFIESYNKNRFICRNITQKVYLYIFLLMN